MLTILVPDALSYSEVLSEIRNEGQIFNGVTYYADGYGGMHRTPEMVAEVTCKFREINRKLWQEVSDNLSR